MPINVLSRVQRKINFGINIPLKVFKKPKHKDSVTSDLFPIRNDENWRTEFEFLNLPGLIRGDISSNHKATIIFFSKEGLELGRKDIELSAIGRKTVQLVDFLIGHLKNSTTFSVFHENRNHLLDVSGSFMAERGYCGYKYKDTPVKGYVHGNLDAVSYSSGDIMKLGNYGLFKKTYFVQHLLTGPSEYIFVITNPTSKKITVSPIIDVSGKNYRIPKCRIPSLGCHEVRVKIDSGELGRVKFKSRFYLGRPVVFRTNSSSFDVFHG